MAVHKSSEPPPSSLYLRPSSARTDHRTTFATPSRTRGTSSPALTFTGGRCLRAAAVAAACSGGHNAGDHRGLSRVALRVRKGTLELVPPLVAVVGDLLAGDRPSQSRPPFLCSPAGGRRKSPAPSLCVLFLCMTGGPGWVTGPTCRFKEVAVLGVYSGVPSELG
jgi:hypothetical protein